jgi:hypothetical protein
MITNVPPAARGSFYKNVKLAPGPRKNFLLGVVCMC